jgi:hypothetical protein
MHRIDALCFDASKRESKKSACRIVNWFLIENPASRRHVRAHPGAALAPPGILLAGPSRRYRGNTGLGRGAIRAGNDCCYPEVTMDLFSRSVIRKRVLAVAATASATTSPEGEVAHGAMKISR